jgi:hypothetical protein
MVRSGEFAVRALPCEENRKKINSEGGVLEKIGWILKRKKFDQIFDVMVGRLNLLSDRILV